MLTVQLLGPVEVWRDGEPVELGGPQQRAVLAHVALEVGRVVSVDRLIDRLWGEASTSGSLGTLQSYVSRLRRALEPSRRTGAAPQVLVSEAPGYVLKLPPEQIDVHRFRMRAAAGRELLVGGRAGEALTAFDDALALWRGPALAGVGPGDEVRPIVVRLEEERDAAVEGRFEALLALGRHVDVLPLLQTAVRDQPMRERWWELLALALYRGQRQADALRTLAEARTILLDELGLDPSPQLRDLEQRILGHDVSLLPTPPAPAASPPPSGALHHVDRAAPSDDTGGQGPPSPAHRASRPIPPPAGALVARAREWAALTETFDEVATTGARLVLLEGEAGIGKSTLEDAMARHAGAHGWHRGVGRCVDAGLAPSLWPWIELSRAVLAVVPPGAADAAEPWRQLGLAGAGSGVAHTAVEMADAFVALLDAAGGRWLLVIDDLHWADRSTLDVLRLVLERVGDRPVLVIGAHRPVDTVPGTALGDALASIVRPRPCVRVAMRPLDTAGVGELIALTTGAVPAPEVVDHVRARAGGNPLFVTELARLAGERGLEETSVVPEAIRDVVRGRLALLPDRATAELEVAAVLGERFDLRTAMVASERDPDACLDALDAAIVTRILVPEAAGFRFAHALVRDAVLAGIAPLRLARLHHRAAEAIVATRGAGPDEAEPIAHHRLASAAYGDPVVVAHAAVRACDVARWRASLDTAEQFAGQALEVLAQCPRTADVLATELLAFEALVDVARRREDDAAGQALAERMAAFAERTGSDAAAGLALFLGWGDIDETDDLRPLAPAVERARLLAERTSDGYAIVATRFMLAAYALLVGRIDEAAEHAEIAVVAAGQRTPGDPPGQVPQLLVPMIAGMVDALRGRPDIAREHVRVRAPAWLAGRRDVDPTAAVALTFDRALVEALLDDPHAVLAELRDRPGVDVPGFVLILGATCEILWVWATIESGIESRIESGIESGMEFGIGSDLAAVLDEGFAAMAVVEAGRERILRPCLRTFLARACLVAGDPRAVDLLEQAEREAHARGETWWLAETLRLRALADERFADGTHATEWRAAAVDLARRQGASMLLERLEPVVGRSSSHPA